MKEKIVYVSDDGIEFDSKNDCILHEGKHICPKCNGVGSVKIRYNAYPSGLPDSGWAKDWKIKDVKCDVCKGKGYTDKLLKPITKVVGYE